MAAAKAKKTASGSKKTAKKTKRGAAKAAKTGKAPSKKPASGASVPGSAASGGVPAGLRVRMYRVGFGEPLLPCSDSIQRGAG